MNDMKEPEQPILSDSLTKDTLARALFTVGARRGKDQGKARNQVTSDRVRQIVEAFLTELISSSFQQADSD